MTGTEKQTYRKAIEELEHILAELEGGTVDVDVLSEKIKRAAALISFCRTRLKKTEGEVKKILADIEGTETEKAQE